MKIETSTDLLISDLVTNLLPMTASVREKHLLRETLNSLVRLAKSEQILEMKSNIRRLTGPLPVTSARARFRASFGGANEVCQQKFEFMKPE